MPYKVKHVLYYNIPRGGQGNPFHYSCLENPMDRGAWQFTVHRVTQSQTRLKQLSTHTHTYFNIEIPVLGIYPREIKICVHKKTYQKHVHISFIHNSLNWNQPKCPSVGKIHTLCYIHTIDYYSAMMRTSYLYI